MNNPLKYTDPSGYVYQGPVEPTAPYFSQGGTKFQIPYEGIIPSGGYSFGTVDWLGTFDVAFDHASGAIGMSRSTSGRSFSDLYSWVENEDGEGTWARKIGRDKWGYAFAGLLNRVIEIYNQNQKDQPNGTRPNKISKREKKTISEQIIDWMIYIIYNPKDDLIFSDILSYDLFVVLGPKNYKAFLEVCEGKDNIWGGTSYVINNPKESGDNWGVATVRPLDGINRFSITQYPTCGNCDEATIINLYMHNDDYYDKFWDYFYKRDN